METFFLACFVFGALFTVLSFALGAISAAPGADVGHFGHLGHAPHAAHGAHPLHGALDSNAPHVAGAHGGHATPGHPDGVRGMAAALHLPLLNASSLLAFLTWFGAAGFLLTHFAGWALAAALLTAAAIGLAGAVLIALFLKQVLAGERVMNPADYTLPGTLARVTVSIPAGGVGEIVFTKGGARRSEAARSLSGAAIPRDTEVVILDHAHGIAAVQPWRELLGRDPLDHPPPPALATPSEPSSSTP